MTRWPALQGRRDSNESGIIAALEAAGATVEQIPTGRGVPDLLVGFVHDGVDMLDVPTNYLIEIKTHHAKLNKKQQEWHNNWAGHKAVARNPTEALEIIGVCVDLDCKCRSAGL